MRSLSSRVLAIANVLATLAACGADVGDTVESDMSVFDDELGTIEQALNHSCGNAGPVQRTFNARATGFTATAAMQTQGCQGDSYMFAIQSYNSGLAPLQNPTITPAVFPGNQADCVATELRFFVWSGSTLRGSAGVNGVWLGQEDGCSLSLVAPATLATGGTYKFAIGGRRLGSLVGVRLEHPYR